MDARTIVVSLAALALAGCPGRNEGLRDAGSVFSPDGNGFEGEVRFHDDELRMLSPPSLPATSSPCRAPELALVARVIDGDTFDIERLADRSTDRVRLIGVDTPEIAHSADEVSECFGDEATLFTRQLLGRTVWLTYDSGCRDSTPSMRALAYVWIGPGASDMWNRQLVRRGYADTLTVPPNSSFQETFANDRADAQREGRGLWTACE